MRKVITTKCAPGTIGPYVQGVDLGSIVLTLGQIPVCPRTGGVAENVSDQACQSLGNVRAIVEFADLKVSDVVKATVFVLDLNDFATINRMYQQLFDEHKTIYPTCSCMQVVHLLKDVKLETETITVRDNTLQSLAGRSQDRPDP